MSITVVRDKGVTVVTVAADEKSMLPPLCQILKTLCYSPMCCSVNKALMQTSTGAALGTIQIMVGLFNLALGPGRTNLRAGDIANMGAAYWLGGVFILAGIMTLLADRFPAMFMVILAVLVNIIGSTIAIFGIVLYGLDVAHTSTERLCGGIYESAPVKDNCTYVAHYYQRLVMAMDISMIILVFLQLLVSISVAFVGISALFNPWSEQDNKADEADEPLLKEVLMTSPDA